MTLQGNPNIVDNGFNNPPSDPSTLMKTWFENSEKANVAEPYGFTLSTVNIEAKPSSRVVLMKSYDELGIIFASSLSGRKGKDFTENPMVSANFWWRETVQQIIISGRIVRMPDEYSNSIFKTRIRSAQAISKLSKQSEPLDDKKSLRQAVRI